MLRFSCKHFWWALALLGAELAIGLCLHDALIRPYGGDFLVVMFLYCLLRSLVAAPRSYVAGAVLLLAYTTEISQYFHLIRYLDWEHEQWAHLLLGSRFAWADLLAYTAGIAVVVRAEARPRPKRFDP